jgi:hypothetical protein
MPVTPVSLALVLAVDPEKFFNAHFAKKNAFHVKYLNHS